MVKRNLLLFLATLLGGVACDGAADSVTGSANGHATIKAALANRTNVTTSLLGSDTLPDGTSYQCLEVDYDLSPKKRHGTVRVIWLQSA